MPLLVRPHHTILLTTFSLSFSFLSVSDVKYKRPVHFTTSFHLPLVRSLVVFSRNIWFKCTARRSLPSNTVQERKTEEEKTASFLAKAEAPT